MLDAWGSDTVQRLAAWLGEFAELSGHDRIKRSASARASSRYRPNPALVGSHSDSCGNAQNRISPPISSAT